MKLEGYYVTLNELPLSNWIKITDGELKYLRRDINKGNEMADSLIYEQVFDEYLTKYGLSKTFNKLLKLIKAKTLLELEYVITNERFKLTEIEIEQAKLESMLSNKNSTTSIETTLIYLSQFMKFYLNPKEITAEYYFNLLTEYEKQSNKRN